MIKFSALAALVAAVPSYKTTEIKNTERGVEVPGDNGWTVSCRVELDNPPAFSLIDGNDLFYTTFAIGPGDAVYRIKNWLSHCNGPKPEAESLFTEFPWPNAIQTVPEELYGPRWFSVSSGFFPNLKNDGCVAVFNADTLEMHYMTPGCKHLQGEHPKFFYHKVEWHDMDQDGDLDMLTARCLNDGPITPINQTLLWFENNGQFPSQINLWKEHEIAAGNNTADVFFDTTYLTRPGTEKEQLVIAISGFYSQQLELVWTEDTDDDWLYVSKHRSIIVDNAGWYFEVEFHDVNGDGKKEMLTTTWSRSDENGALFTYSINSADWRNPDSWFRHDIYTRFPRFLNAGFGSPGGFATGLKKAGDNRETIWVSGDDDGQVYQHVPLSDFPSNWRYETNSIYKTDDNIGYATLTGATIGQIQAIDHNKDGFADILIPNYTRNEMIILEQCDSDIVTCDEL